MILLVPGPTETVRVAAAGDIHCSEENREHLRAAFERVEGEADLVLLAGDLTTHGEPAEAAVLAEITSGLDLPIYAVLGNHDWHADRALEVTAALAAGRVIVLERSAAVCDVRGLRVGIAGTKGFVGGFPDAELPDFGEPLLRQIYAETTNEVKALERGLGEIEDCALRIVLLHYAPTTTTLAGERQTIWAFLGSDRLSAPILEHRPHLVVHGHGHAGTFEGFVGPVPVFNVAVPLLGGRDFFVFELESERGLVRAEPEPTPRATQRAET
jgi:Icc-related predicted phosphoesterase